MTDWQFELEDPTVVDVVRYDGKELKRGDRVRLRPGGDIFDLILAGKTGLIDSIERDYESRIHLAVIIDEDAGREFGRPHLPGHRLFFSPNEVEPIGDG